MAPNASVHRCIGAPQIKNSIKGKRTMIRIWVETRDFAPRCFFTRAFPGRFNFRRLRVPMLQTDCFLFSYGLIVSTRRNFLNLFIYYHEFETILPTYFVLHHLFVRIVQGQKPTTQKFGDKKHTSVRPYENAGHAPTKPFCLPNI